MRQMCFIWVVLCSYKESRLLACALYRVLGAADVLYLGCVVSFGTMGVLYLGCGGLYFGYLGCVVSFGTMGVLYLGCGGLYFGFFWDHA